MAVACAGTFALGFGANQWLGSANPGDRLAFAGAMFGAAAAVIGTAIIDARSKRQNLRDAREHLAAICDSAGSHASELLKPFVPDLTDYAPYGARKDAVRDAINGLLAERYEFDDADLRREAGWVHEMQLLRRAMYDSEPELRSMRDRQDIANGDQMALQGALTSVAQIATKIQSLAKNAAAALRG